MDICLVITTYYRNDRLERAIQSGVDQTRELDEIIVVDGTGEAYARSVTEHFDEVDLVAMEEDRGLGGSRDEGVTASDAEYVHFLDDDDYLHQDAILKMEQKAKETGAGVIYSGLKWSNGHEVRPDPSVQGDVLSESLTFKMAPCLPSMMMVRRELFEQIAPTARLPIDDGAMKIELAQITEFEYVNEALTIRGKTDNSLGGDPVTAEKRFEMLDYYKNLYEEQPDWVEREARSRSHLLAGTIAVQNSRWSPTAIRHFLLANYYRPRISVPHLGALIASLFGRFGWSVGMDVYNRYFLGKNHSGTLD